MNLLCQYGLYFSLLYFINAPASQLRPRNSSGHFTMIAAFITVLAADTCCLPSCGQDKQSNYQRCGLVPAKFLTALAKYQCSSTNTFHKHSTFSDGPGIVMMTSIYVSYRLIVEGLPGPNSKNDNSYLLVNLKIAILQIRCWVSSVC